MTVPASTAPQCAPSARLAWGREGRGGERKRGVGHPLYSVPVLFGLASSDGAFLALAAPGHVWRWLGGEDVLVLACVCGVRGAFLVSRPCCWWACACKKAASGSCRRALAHPNSAGGGGAARWQGFSVKPPSHFPLGISPAISQHLGLLCPQASSVATQSCFGRAMVAVLCCAVAHKACLPPLAACSQPQPPRAAEPPACPRTLPVLCAPGCVTGSVGSWHPACACDPARICPLAAKFQNLWGV